MMGHITEAMQYILVRVRIKLLVSSACFAKFASQKLVPTLSSCMNNRMRTAVAGNENQDGRAQSLMLG